SNMRVEPLAAMADGIVTIHVDISNTGKRAGDEVAQLYVHQNGSRVTRPIKELKGFKRISLEPGETKTVTFRLAVNQLAHYDADNRFVVEPGPVDVMVGNSSRDIYCNQEFEISGEKREIRGNKVYFSKVD